MQNLRNIEMHVTANQNYIEEGIKLLQLARRAHELFENQPAKEKRKLLDFVLSNSVWKNGKLLAEYSQPFDVLALAIASDQGTRSLEPARVVENENWLPAGIRTVINGFFAPKQVRAAQSEEGIGSPSWTQWPNH